MNSKYDIGPDDIIPLPENTIFFNKRVTGIVPCACGDAKTVRPDKNGVLWAWCDTLLTVHKCKRNSRLADEVKPAQTLENFESHDLSLLPREYQELLNKAWGISENSKQKQEVAQDVNEPSEAENSRNSETEEGPKPARKLGSLGF